MAGGRARQSIGLTDGMLAVHIGFQPQAALPAIGKVLVHLLAQLPLGPDAHAIADISIRIISSGSIEGRPVEL